MKRVLAILLCLTMMLSVSACKPDNITYPSVITPNDQTDTPQEQPEEPVENTDPAPQQPEEEEEPAIDKLPQEEPLPEEKTEEQPEETPDASLPSEGEEITPAEPDYLIKSPLAGEGIQFSKTAGSTLSLSGLVKDSQSLSPLANRTIVVYTADDTPAFYYTNEKGHSVSEWEWMKLIAAEQGFMLKYEVKNKATSLKAQRTALYAGQKLSLIQMQADELGVGMTLSRPAIDHLNTEITPFGISKGVLTQSNYTLFAPMGNINAIWYNPARVPAAAEPATLAQTNQWTVEQYKTIHAAAISQSVVPLQMGEILAWATLSGKSPLTLLEGKLDSNIHAAAVQEVWSLLRTTNQELTAFVPVPEVTYSLSAGNVAMAYTAIPDAAKDLTYRFAPLPAMTEGAAGTVTYTGTFLALPKYRVSEEEDHAALTFAELWCNRYTETLAGKLQALGVVGNSYNAFINMAEAQGYLILHQPKIEELTATYLQGLTDPLIDMEEAYSAVRNSVNNLITTQNIYY